ncbi:MAG: hypothetical protein KZQ64_07620 [gamma proteobacterium symbiont of Bathyaustriella thionipta]|nr:hypothetical protein [gamma proteobacterium symbiont of Bathyaustriella thionipta]MCU7950511.1 hypothetical protein [gamma proteobacterium symbiont of Bathyaustriella thionipta]MCU7953240.1 hypothetical protein [gamma proteobacterium symbiont of Bathyaustriella thionipta]MCU7957005.1 hypothetical protein [gamma proteobacterium symbiont of Bathyaustriella thionipta]MCU7965935.1 hypothetical protein [gamma proteobacterium symbiont of Bathyaustriella thionipta]
MGKNPLNEINMDMVNELLDSLADGPCNIAISVLKRTQKVALKYKKKTGLNVPFIFDTDRRKMGKRTRKVEDLPGFISFLQDNERYKSYKNAMMAQLLYGTRAQELNELKWCEVKGDIIQVPWQRLKTKHIADKPNHDDDDLILPVMPAMKNILDQQKGFSDIFVFPQLNNDRPMSNGCGYITLGRSNFKNSSHDIRRTVASRLRVELNATVDDIDLILNHSVGTVNDSYIQGTPLERKRKILSIWHNYIDSLMTETGVQNHG